MFASLLMSTRGRPISVWLGAALAFCVHVALATTIGFALFHVLQHRAVDAVVAGLFVVGAGLAFREGLHERQHHQSEEKRVEAEVRSGRRTVTTAFIVIFIAEWGDLTQILTAFCGR